MPFLNLHDFITTLEKHKKLIRVAKPVSCHLEMTEIQTRLLAQKGPAVLFEKPLLFNGDISPIPVLINLFGTIERVAMGMEQPIENIREFGKLLAALRQPTPPSGLKDTWEKFPMLKRAMAMKPQEVKQKHAPCQQIVLVGEQVDLTTLPIQGCWPNEPAPLITWPIVITKGPTHSLKNSLPEDDFNLGIYRMQLLNKKQTIMRWLQHRGGAQHFSRWQKMYPEKPMPTAVVIGADPGTILSAVTPVPDTLSEYKFAGLLRGERISLVPCQTIPLSVPAQAEIVLEGHILPHKTAPEGPYGDHTGYYNSIENFPVFDVSAITMRKNPVYLSTFTGRPPDEPSILSEALNDLFVPILQQQFPEIKDFWLPPEGCSYRIAVISLKKAYPGHAKRIMMGAWSFLRQFLYTKYIIVIDSDLNARCWKDVIWALSTCTDPARDITIIENTPIDYLDFASPASGLGSKIGIDATTKIPPETNRQWGEKIKMNDDVIKTISEKWKDLGLPGNGKPIWK